MFCDCCALNRRFQICAVYLHHLCPDPYLPRYSIAVYSAWIQTGRHDRLLCRYRIINQNRDALKYSVLIHIAKRKRVIWQRSNKVEILLNRDRLETIITFNNNILRLGIFKVFPVGFFYVANVRRLFTISVIRLHSLSAVDK